MPRSMVGLLAAVGAAMSALVGLLRGEVAWVALADAAAATGLAAYLALPPNKKPLHVDDSSVQDYPSSQHRLSRCRFLLPS